MACSPIHLLCYPLPKFSIKFAHHTQFLIKPPNLSPFELQPVRNSSLTSAQVTECMQVPVFKETPKFRWVEIKQDKLTETQKHAISKLPRKMEKRCKAFMRQIICFTPEMGSLSELLAAWVKIMKPTRADWLSVLKELRFLDHPVFPEISRLVLFEESFEANVRDYTKLIHLYAKHERVEDAEKILLAMCGRGLTCDQVTFTTMIHMYSKAGHFELAKETFEEMKLLGQQLDRRSYGSMIMAYIRADMPDKGEDLIKQMEDKEIYAGREVYKALLRAYSMMGDAEGAQRVFDAVQVAGISPDIKLCGLLINAYVLAGQSQKACIAFGNMRKAGIEPDDKCVALLLSAYERDNRINTAMDFLASLEREGILIGKEASLILVEWFKRLGVVEDVAHVLREFAEKRAAS